jgi:hypothetical protein
VRGGSGGKGKGLSLMVAVEEKEDEARRLEAARVRCMILMRCVWFGNKCAMS